jgi:hypothetical protein
MEKIWLNWKIGESDVIHLRMLLFTLEGKDTGALYV